MKTIQPIIIVSLLLIATSCVSKKSTIEFTSIADKEWKLVEINNKKIANSSSPKSHL